MSIPCPSGALAVPPKEWTFLGKGQDREKPCLIEGDVLLYFIRDSAPFQLMFAKKDSM